MENLKLSMNEYDLLRLTTGQLVHKVVNIPKVGLVTLEMFLDGPVPQADGGEHAPTA